MDKKEFREEAKKLRDSLPEVERLKESELVFEKLTQLDCYAKAERILSFMKFGSEIEVEVLNKKIMDCGKILYLPRMKDKGELSIVEYGNGFTVGQFGIKEPIGSEYLGELDLIVVPGLAFDRKGNRLGYGKGYYDRLFCRYADTLKIAPIFESQLFEEIPTEEHDIKIDIIITKNEILKLKNY